METRRKIETFKTSTGITIDSLDGNYLNTTSLSGVETGYDVLKECYDSINYLFSIPIPNAEPYWALGSFEDDETTLHKGLMYGGDQPRTVNEYLLVSNPLPSDLVFEDELYIQYERGTCAGTTCFRWTEPLIFDVKIDAKRWNKLVVDSCIQSDIQDWIINGCSTTGTKTIHKCPSCCSEKVGACGCEMENFMATRYGLTASNDPSDLILTTRYDAEPVFVNYYARNRITALPINVIDSTAGIPPTGGNFVPVTSGVFAEAEYPYQNLVSLFHPIVAAHETEDLRYTKRDAGFFTPERLGFTRLDLNVKQMEFVLDTTRSASSVEIVLDPSLYDSSLFQVKEADAREIKKLSYGVGGQIRDSRDYQEFVPYQSSFESLKFNKFGIQNQSDLIDPWVGPSKSTPHKDVSRNFRNEPLISCGPDAYFNSIPEISGTLLQWKTDIFGNQYGLYKSIGAGETIFTKDQTGGTMWVRDLRNAVGVAREALDDVFDNHAANDTLFGALTGDGIIQFDIFYDTLFLLTETNLIIERLNTNYDTGNIFSNADNSMTFEFASPDVFAGWWLNERTKTVTFGYMSGGIPQIYEYDIDNVDFTKIYPGTDTEAWEGGFPTTRSNKLTYNTEKNVYNYTFLTEIEGESYVVTTDISLDVNTVWKSDVIRAIRVSDIDDIELLRTRYHGDDLLLIFERQVTPNQIFQVVIQPTL